jgi:2-oxoisovalerate dehydrogenase E1 component
MTLQPIDWERVLYLTLASRSLDDIEETKLVPEKKVLYQFSARGHDVAQVILGQHLTHPHDAAGATTVVLTLGLALEDGFAGPMEVMVSDGATSGWSQPPVRPSQELLR